MRTPRSILMVLFFLTLSNSVVLAAGVNIPSNQESLWSNINLPGFAFGYGTSSADGKTNFSANMTNSDRLSGISIAISRDTGDPTRGSIYASFNGVVGDSPFAMESQSQSMDIIRHGVEYSSYAGLSAYQEVLWPRDGEERPVYGDWLSSGSVYMTLLNVTPTWADSRYAEQFDDWSGVTRFYGSVHWQVEFIDSTSTEFVETGFGTSVSSPIPEPATLSLLALGTAAIAVKRRRR